VSGTKCHLCLRSLTIKQRLSAMLPGRGMPPRDLGVTSWITSRTSVGAAGTRNVTRVLKSALDASALTRHISFH
jgi:hypothetical protein